MMSPFISLFCFAAIAFLGIYGFDIERVDIPYVIRNGTGPVNLSCIYDVGDDEHGLVVKWYHNENQLIYQWIPPMTPQDIGVIAGRAEYPDEVLNNPRSHSVIRLQEVTLEMGGNYTCVVSTFQSEATKTESMIVYAPERNASISTPAINDTHIKFVCEFQGAWPQPVLHFKVEGVPVESRIVWLEDNQNYENNGFRIRHEAVIEEPKTLALLECKITIPGTDYRRRKGIVYYPREFLSELSTAFQKNNSSLLKVNYTQIIAFTLSLILSSSSSYSSSSLFSKAIHITVK